MHRIHGLALHKIMIFAICEFSWITSVTCVLGTQHYGDDKMTKFTKSFLSNESGATAIEYGLIAALIAVAAIAAMTTLGGKLNSTFTNVSGKLV
jgi:pilus assembly protein Flp/PilA